MRMRGGGWRAKRRLAALVAVLSLAFSWFEIAFPDVHDGDAAGTAVTTVVLASGGSGAGGAAMADLDAAVSAGHEGAPSRHSSSVPSPHRIHVDHCGHSHAGSTAERVSLPAPCVLPSAPAPSTVVMPPTVDLPPHLRPPIA